jgi:hypothetical protein
MGTRKDEKGNDNFDAASDTNPQNLHKKITKATKTDSKQEETEIQGQLIFTYVKSGLPFVAFVIFCKECQSSWPSAFAGPTARQVCDLLVEILSVRSLFPTTYEAAR